MLYTEFTVGGNEYKLRLPSKQAAVIEQKLNGKSLLAVLGDGGLKDLPNINTLVLILHGSLQAYHHGISIDDTYDIYDKYIEHGGSYVGAIQILVDVLKVSGFFREPPKKTSK